MMRNVVKIGLLALLVCKLTACRPTELEAVYPTTATAGMISVEMVLPGHQLPAARNGMTGKEFTIDPLYALAFETATNTYIECQKVEAADIQTGSAYNRKQFKINTDNFAGMYKNIHLVLVTNVNQDKIDELTSGTVYTDTDIQEKLLYPAIQNWESIPMWGKSSAFDSENPAPLTIHLLRALAKFKFAYPANQPGRFQITKVHVFNAAEEFYVVPRKENLDPLRNNQVAIQPTLPPSPHNGVKNWEFDFPDAPDSNQLTFYLPEQPKGKQYNSSTPDEWLDENFHFVVEGKYKSKEHKIDVCYYRINLATSPDQYLAALRNHSYTIYIANPLKPGKTNMKEARQQKPEDFSVANIVCDEGDIFHLASTSNYALGVNRLEFHRDNRQQTITCDAPHTEDTPNTFLKVFCTDHNGVHLPDNWKFNITDENGQAGPTWINAAKEGSDKNGLKIELASYNDVADTVYARTAHIHIYAFDSIVSHTVKVVQYNQSLVKAYTKIKKFWLVNYRNGKGLVIRAATDWNARLLEDDKLLVKEIVTLQNSLNNYDTKLPRAKNEKDLFFIRLINGWNKTAPFITYDNPAQVVVRFQSKLDPALYTDYTFNLFEAMVRHGLYISPAEPDNAKNGIHQKLGLKTWDHATGTTTGCQALGNGPGGKPWRMPKPTELLKIMRDADSTESAGEFDDKIYNLWHTFWFPRDYLIRAHWELTTDRGGEAHPRHLFSATPIDAKSAKGVKIYLTPNQQPISFAEQWILPKNREDGYRNVISYFCVSDVN